MTISLFGAAVLLCGLFVGFIPALVDGAKKGLQNRLKLPDGGADGFVTIFYAAWLLAMPVAGWMLDQWHNKEILFFGLVALILALSWLAMAANPTALHLSALCLGLAYSCVAASTISFMPHAFFPGDADAHGLNTASLNLGFVAVGLGAMLGAGIVPCLDRWVGISQGMLYVSTLLIVPAGLTALCERIVFPPAVVAASSQEMFAGPHLMVIGISILLYFALENCLEYWPRTLDEDPNKDNTAPAPEYALGQAGSHPVFWFLFVASRGVAAWHFYHHPGHATGATIALVLISTVILFNLVGGFEFGVGPLLYWFVGLCYGPLLPGFLGMAMDLFPNPLPVGVLGILLALSGLDTLLVRPAMSYFTLNRSPRSVLWAPLGLSLLLWLPLVIFVVVRI
ncbi:MAG: hypothetical protein HYR84_01195 [Planctomycetes bacterium]|nr:hypothetical protein [Planctomycetota bacterium]